MTPGLRRVFGLVFWLAIAADQKAATKAADPDKDPQPPKLLQEARTLLDNKKPQAAIVNCDKVIGLFKAHYGKRKEKVYCGRTPAENLGYLMKAAAAMNDGKFEAGKKQAIVISPTWSKAFFMKAFALAEMGNRDEAMTALQEAIALSPWNSQYLSELGYLYAVKKDWAKAMETYQAAEEHAALSPDDTKTEELGRARRGVGYVLVELGKLDEAEKKYEQCLKENPQDKKAAAELEDVRQRKAKGKSA
ncbi:MAG TPA: tetratricopeptide repeat protein [Chthoniobacterales bacterium]|nr:tetratricopeptide repeat protein [Chthoniobacterales bacterium]